MIKGTSIQILGIDEGTKIPNKDIENLVKL
jgi:hypothetical protein